MIRCAYFRNRQKRTSPSAEEGMAVLLSGQISYYEPRGDLQFIVSYMEEAGEGALRRAFEELKTRLEKEGLFDSQHKHPLPDFPKSIGVITSESGAAIHDILVTLNRRFPLANVIVYPTTVQGVDAPKNIINAINIAEQRKEAEVLILTRGGGSLDDLQGFNDEAVARKVFQCSIPLVSAIGHEVDFTICDFVADYRAPTPTAAAEIVAPEIQQIKQQFSNIRDRMLKIVSNILRDQQQTLDFVSSRLIHPSQKLEKYRARHDTAKRELIIYCQRQISERQHSLTNYSHAIAAYSPARRVKNLQLHQNRLSKTLIQLTRSRVTAMHNDLKQLRGKVQLMSPEHTLNRGYAIVQNRIEKVITDPKQIKKGETLKVKVSRGDFDVIVNNNPNV